MLNIYSDDFMIYEVYKKDFLMNKMFIFIYRILEVVYMFREYLKCFYVDFFLV